MKEKPCLNCGKTIIKPQNESLKNWENRRKYCSRRCSGLYRVKLRGEFGRPFRKGQKAINPIKKGQHLSPQTQFKKGLVPWNKNKKGVMPTPWNKGKRFTQIIGEKHHAWKGGRTSLRMRIRNLPETENWRKAIFERDNYTCLICKRSSGGKRNTPERVTLNADHFPHTFVYIIDSFNITTISEATSCKLLWDIKNGRTLCERCHRKVTKEQGQHHYKVKS